MNVCRGAGMTECEGNCRCSREEMAGGGVAWAISHRGTRVVRAGLSVGTGMLS